MGANLSCCLLPLAAAGAASPRCAPTPEPLPRAVDRRKLRRLIRGRRLAPWPHGSFSDDRSGGESDCDAGVADSCPICVCTFAAGVNLTACCAAPCCTLCFVQLQCSTQPPGSAGCPFCRSAPLLVRVSCSGAPNLPAAAHACAGCQ